MTDTKLTTVTLEEGKICGFHRETATSDADHSISVEAAIVTEGRLQITTDSIKPVDIYTAVDGLPRSLHDRFMAALGRKTVYLDVGLLDELSFKGEAGSQVSVVVRS